MKSAWSLKVTLAALSLLSIIPSLAGGAEPLLIAVASDGQQATSLVSNFAARCQHYLLFDETMQLVEVAPNPFLPRGRGAAPLVVDYLAQKGVGVVVAGRFGPYMIEAINSKGMKYIQFSGVAQDAVERVVNLFKPRPQNRKLERQ
jgi:predicted Fe-Mo cluster-binding NifX family protein